MNKCNALHRRWRITTAMVSSGIMPRQQLTMFLSIPRESSMDSLDWSRKYDILSISRLVLRDELGFSAEQIQSLSDDDMQAIAETLHENLLHAAGIDFTEEVRFVMRVFFTERSTDNRTGDNANGT